MESLSTLFDPSARRVLWAVADAIFAIALPGSCLLSAAMLAGMLGRSCFDLQMQSYWWFAALEVVLYVVWLASRRRHSPRTSALFAGALAAGSFVAATIAISMLVATGGEMPRHRTEFVIGLALLSIPAGTAVAFGRAAWRAWCDASLDPSFEPWFRAVAVGLPLLASCFFFRASERAALAWSLARVDRGDAHAVQEAALGLRFTPWADTTPLFWEWQRRRWRGLDATAIADLYERVTGSTPDSRLESNRYK